MTLNTIHDQQYSAAAAYGSAASSQFVQKLWSTESIWRNNVWFGDLAFILTTIHMKIGGSSTLWYLLQKKNLFLIA